MTPKLILRGTRIILMTIDNLKFIDSFNYFPLPLSKLPEALDLGSDFKKGYFPHFFNTKANMEYVGPMPSVKYYGHDSMRENDRLAFLEWYKHHNTEVFDMKRDMVAYCTTDVEILIKACLKFRDLFMSKCNVCPFTESVTIASSCNLVYRRNFLKPQTIGVLPRGGYRGRYTQSKIVASWLIWQEVKRGINIQSAVKNREAIVEGVKVDGFCEKIRLVFEFNGCWFHGCPKCFMADREKPLHDDPTDCFNSRYERTVRKTHRLQKRNYEVIVTWECEFREQMEQNKEIKEIIDKHPLSKNTPLNPRDAFYGGRTGNCKTYYQCVEEEEISYVDVCSLYPWVCKYGKFPVGHPTIYIGEDCYGINLQKTEGLIKCKILPPTNLYHPVLPTKMNDKLLFLLCHDCGLTKNSDKCEHSDEQRALTGTWVMDEVLKAVEKGYQIMEIYEIWQYKIERYDKLNKFGGLFTEMMNTFIKMKQAASGWPRNCTTEEKKNAYIEEFFEKEGIRLEYGDILENPALRSLAKLILNSFWGKFGQRPNQAKTVIVNQSSVFHEYLSNPSIEIKQIVEVNEDVLIVNYEHIEETADLMGSVNVCIAAYTTTQARLKLYSYLEKLEERVLYYDTDSVLYIKRKNEYCIPTGNSLGEMTNELEEFGSGSHIITFVCGGPKNYSFLVFSPEFHTYFTISKVKGIRLDYDTHSQLNFMSMCQMITAEEPWKPLTINFSSIQRTKTHQVVTRDETKIYRPRSEKRVFLRYDSLPYGYRK